MKRHKILAFVTNGKKLLALKTAEHPEHGPSKWFIVTGSLEEQENEKEAIKREVKEETNLGIEDILDLNWGSIYLWDDEECHEKNFIVFVKEGEVKLNEEHIEFEWLELNDFVERIGWDLDKTELRKVLEAALKKEIFFKEPKIDDFRKKI